MPRIYKSAKGESVNFDAVMIKNQLAQAPMNIEVARRKNFIDSKEEKPRRVNNIEVPAGAVDNSVSVTGEPTKVAAKPSDFEVEDAPAKIEKPAPGEDGPVPNLPVRE